jgi:antitoxin (DNA-binding transcriptional repressor) of toxin-antitoxin stability system
MCYMKALKRVGVRELRQNLSVHLARVIEGETLEVTDRGHAVAVLAPLPPTESVLDRLEREGNLIRGTGDLLEGLKPVKPPSPGWAARELQRQRADRRF